MSTSPIPLNSDAIDVVVGDASLTVTLADGRELTAPIQWFPRLRDTTPDQRSNWRLIGGGEGVHWPEIDEDIAIATLLRAR